MSALGHRFGVFGWESRMQILTTFRSPQFLVPSLLLPAMLYGVFGIALTDGNLGMAKSVWATYVIFASISPGLFGLGAGIAADREAGLLALKLVSPMPPSAYVVGKLAAGLLLTMLSLLLLSMLAAAGGVVLPGWRWVAVLLLGGASSVPFALVGLNLGLWLSGQGAIAAANVLLLSFCMLGGLWIPLAVLPGWVVPIAWVMPSFHLAQLSLDLAGVHPAQNVGWHLLVVAMISAAAAASAVAGWRRDSA